MSKKKATQYVPDQELIDFAKEFSKTYKSLNPPKIVPQILKSSKKRYLIKYFSGYITNWQGIPIGTDCRIGNTSGDMEFSQKRLCEKNMTRDYVFFITLWLNFKNELFKREPDWKCDAHTFRYMRKNFPSVKPKRILKGLIQCFVKAQTDSNKNRIERMFKLIEKENAKQR